MTWWYGGWMEDKVVRKPTVKTMLGSLQQKRRMSLITFLILLHRVFHSPRRLWSFMLTLFCKPGLGMHFPRQELATIGQTASLHDMPIMLHNTGVPHLTLHEVEQSMLELSDCIIWTNPCMYIYVQYMCMYVCKCLYNIYGLSDRWDAFHWLSLSPDPWLVSAPSWYQLLPYSSIVNRHTHKAWCDLLKETLNRENIEDNCIWATDETGFQPDGGPKQHIFGPSQKKTQHQQQDGNRENITVMVMICANGESISPLAIYKGQAFSTNWHQDNELKARYVNRSWWWCEDSPLICKSVTHSHKGWTDGVIGRLWIQDFNEKTQAKANGRACVLLVNGPTIRRSF